jgi:hypothetical protein
VGNKTFTLIIFSQPNSTVAEQALSVFAEAQFLNVGISELIMVQTCMLHKYLFCRRRWINFNGL